MPLHLRSGDVAVLAYIVLGGGCTANPQPSPPPSPQSLIYDVAYIDQNGGNGLNYIRFVSTTGVLSEPLVLPDGMEVHLPGDNALSWTGDGERLAFSVLSPGNWLDLYSIHSNGTDLKQHTSGPHGDMGPAYSPDGTRLAFTRTPAGQGGGRDIYVQDLASGLNTKITATSGSYEGPSWSPDNAKLAFLHHTSGAVKIVVYSLAAATFTSIPLSISRAQFLRWEPSGTQFVLSTGDTYSDVYTMDIGGTGLTNRTTESADDMSVFGAPYSGGRLLYTRRSAGDWIYFMNANGTGKTPLVRITTDLPWSPVHRTPASRPDLVPWTHSGSLDTSDSANPKYVVKFTVANIGTAASGSCLVQVNALNPTPPAGQNAIRLQSEATVPGLAPGQESASLQATFALSRMHAFEVQSIEMLVDSKSQVDERLEINNRLTWDWQ